MSRRRYGTSLQLGLSNPPKNYWIDPFNNWEEDGRINAYLPEPHPIAPDLWDSEPQVHNTGILDHRGEPILFIEQKNGIGFRAAIYDAEIGDSGDEATE